MERKLISAIFQLKTALSQCTKEPYRIGTKKVEFDEPVFIGVSNNGTGIYRTHVYSSVFYSPLADIERLKNRIIKLTK